MKTILFIFVASLFGLHVLGQEPVNYKHKTFYKEINKIWKKNDFEISKVAIPDSIEENNLAGQLFMISGKNGIFGKAYVGRVNSCRSGGCSISNSMDESFEYFDYFILYDAANLIKKVKVFNYQATHGYEITSKSWLKQFLYFTGNSELKVGKNIDAISGATMSANSIVADIQKITDLVSTYFSEKIFHQNMQNRK